jgi:hypothetical protein
MKKLVLILALAVGTATFAAAQSNITYGARVALGSNSYSVAQGGHSASESGFGWQLGVVADIGLPQVWENFSVKPGLSIVSKGMKDRSLYYLEIPILAAVALPINDQLAITGGIGPNIGIGISGENKAFDYLSRLNIGLDFEAGVKVVEKFTLSAFYSLGLTNTIKDAPSGVDATLSTVGVKLGYNF